METRSAITQEAAEEIGSSAYAFQNELSQIRESPRPSGGCGENFCPLHRKRPGAQGRLCGSIGRRDGKSGRHLSPCGSVSP